MGFFGWLNDLKQYRPKLGEAVAVVWKKEDGTACGGTEGFVLGVAGDEVSGEYLVLDQRTHQDSSKSNIFSLDLLDLRVIPLKNVNMIEKTDIRRRPPGSSEKFTLTMDAVYKSNIDFNDTRKNVKERGDCEVGPISSSKSEAEYGIKIKRISSVKGASINIMATGTIQIICKHEQIDDCIKWIHEAVELLPGHKRLVLFSTKVTYKINDTIKEKARPTDEVIDRVAKAKGPPIVIFPIGWAHEFFAKLDENPLQKLFPGCQPLENFVIRDENRKKKIFTLPAVSEEAEPKQFVDLKFPDRVGNVTQHLGLVSPIIRLSSVMEDSSPEYEEYLIRTWLSMRSDPWQWFSSNLINGKMIVGDLNIDKKTRIWTLDLREYSSSAEFSPISGSSGSDKSNHRK